MIILSLGDKLRVPSHNSRGMVNKLACVNHRAHERRKFTSSGCFGAGTGEIFLEHVAAAVDVIGLPRDVSRRIAGEK